MNNFSIKNLAYTLHSAKGLGVNRKKKNGRKEKKMKSVPELALTIDWFRFKYRLE